MEIDCILAVIKNSLITVKYIGEEENEFYKLFDNWTDPQYLTDFFTEHENDLRNGYYSGTTIEEAVEKTIEDAEKLERFIYDLAEEGIRGQDGMLQHIFNPLDNMKYNLSVLLESKAKGRLRRSWIRVYAIRIGPNTYVITGGAIKLTLLMDKPHLRLELRKLEIVKQYLKDNGLLDPDDFEYLEI